GSSFSAEASVFNTSGGSPAYIVSKAAIRALSRKAAIDLSPHGIRVNVIAPGTVDSPMHVNNQALIAQEALTVPLGRLAVPDDLAGSVLFLASRASAYITGQTIHVNGGRLMAG
ncbi:MAG TPA: SDR family oxidoreductase, partial [Rugosimonospora sp.]|nr:SDR family oxidoreductase [Rugosimonospora sp.]